jgi:predicted N-acetyltransferase YhbS
VSTSAGENSAASDPGGFVIRAARADDIDRVLDLLTHYDQPRAAFEPWYEHDPAYQPEQSWLAETNGRLVAHLRIYPRRLRLGGGGTMRVAGIGNVITAREARGQGHADRLLRAAVSAAAGAGYAYSLLWTHLPQLYSRHGYGEAPEEILHAVTGLPSANACVRPADDAELPVVAALQNRFDADRSGPAVRDLAFWRGSRNWLGDDVLVSDRSGSVAGYIRRRVERDHVNVLELGVATDDLHLGRVLLAAAAEPRQGRLRATLPPSLRRALDPWQPAVLDSPGLMGRPLSIAALAGALSLSWSSRLRAVRNPRDVVVPIALPGGLVSLRISTEGVQAMPEPAAAPPLHPGELTALVLRGCDARTVLLLGDRADLDDLSAIAPAQDFVLWPTDAF